MKKKLDTPQGIFNQIKKKGKLATKADTPDITIDDVREWKKQLDAANIQTRRIKGYHGGVPFDTGSIGGMDAVIKAYPEIWGKAFEEAAKKIK